MPNVIDHTHQWHCSAPHPRLPSAQTRNGRPLIWLNAMTNVIYHTPHLHLPHSIVQVTNTHRQTLYDLQGTPPKCSTTVNPAAPNAYMAPAQYFAFCNFPPFRIIPRTHHSPPTFPRSDASICKFGPPTICMHACVNSELYFSEQNLKSLMFATILLAQFTVPS